MDPEISPQFEDHAEYLNGRAIQIAGRKILPAFKSFQYHDFRWLWLGTFAHFMSISMQQITRGWLVLRLTDDSPFALALVMISFALPLTFASLLGGALADRFPKKQLMIASQVGYLIITLLLAILDFTGLIRFWHLIIIGIFNGTMAAVNMPSRQSMIADIVPEKDLMNAISLNSSGINLTRIIGPAVAGVLILYINTSGVFFLISIINAFAIMFTVLIRDEKGIIKKISKSLASDVIEGFRYAKGNPTLFGLVIMTFVPSLFGFPYVALLPAWSKEALNAQSDGLGLLMMTMGLGSLVGTITLASIRRFNKRGIFLMVNGFIWGLVLIIFSNCFRYVTALPSLFFVGFISAIFMALNMTLMQFYSSDEMRGRVVSMSMMTFGIMPLSAAPFGAIAESIGTSASLNIAGLVLCLFMVIFFLCYPKFRDIS